MEDILNLDINNMTFLEKPPMEAGKIVKVVVEDSPYSENKVLRIYIIDKDTDFVRSVSAKISDRKPSKFSILIEKLKEAGFTGTLKQLEGKIFKWEFKEIPIGSFKTNMWLPVKLIGEEPITVDEVATVEEYISGLNANK